MVNPATATGSGQEGGTSWQLVIHGGAGRMTRDRMPQGQDEAVRAGLAAALEAGSLLLAAGRSAVDAVMRSVMTLEDDPLFNAGLGSALGYDGTVQLDAAIMNGSDRAAGAVAAVSTVRNPVLLARRVMDASPHVFLSGAGAEEFAAEQALEPVDPAWFEIPERRRQWREFRARKTGHFDVDMKYGTVGAVALDQMGNVAAATSTGGLTGKRWGRIGDSPVIGAGTWADNRACAVSATGVGEYFIRMGVAHEIGARMRLKGENLATAAHAVVLELGELGGIGGVICVSPGGEAVWAFNAPGMYRARASGLGEKRIAIYADE